MEEKMLFWDRRIFLGKYGVGCWGPLVRHSETWMGVLGVLE